MEEFKQEGTNLKSTTCHITHKWITEALTTQILLYSRHFYSTEVSQRKRGLIGLYHDLILYLDMTFSYVTP